MATNDIAYINPIDLEKIRQGQTTLARNGTEDELIRHIQYQIDNDMVRNPYVIELIRRLR